MMNTFGADDCSTYLQSVGVGGPSLTTEYLLFLKRNYTSHHLKHPIPQPALSSKALWHSLAVLGYVLKFHEDRFNVQCVEQKYDKDFANSIAVYIISTYSLKVTLSLQMV